MKMKPHTNTGFSASGPLHVTSPPRASPGISLRRQLIHVFRQVSCCNRRQAIILRRNPSVNSGKDIRDSIDNEHENKASRSSLLSRRQALLAPSLALGAWFLKSTVASADDSPPPSSPSMTVPVPVPRYEEKIIEEDVITSRIYDATAIGEPMAVGKDKSKVWEKLMKARILYLGEAEQVPIRDDKELELEIVKNLGRRCLESDRALSLALEAFPCNLQDQLDQYMNKRLSPELKYCIFVFNFRLCICCCLYSCLCVCDGSIDGEALKSYTSHWPPQRWEEYEPLLSYCRDNGVRLVACGTPLTVF